MRILISLVVVAVTTSLCRGAPATSSVFLEGESAMLEKMQCSVGTIEHGTPIFTDRNFLFYEPPAGLKGMYFLRASINGKKPVKIARAGLITVITPSPDVSRAPCSQAAKLEDAKFTWIQAPNIFQLFGEHAMNQCRIYQKKVKVGEQLLLNKWAVITGFNPDNLDIFQPNQRVQTAIDNMLKDETIADAFGKSLDILCNQPEYVVFIPKQPMDRKKCDPTKTGDTYNDHFQVIEHKGKLFAFWTQATSEAHADQHIAFSKSLDKGATWSEPICLAGSLNKTNPRLLASWQQPMISKSGRIYVLWNQQTTSRGPHCGQMFGIYSNNEGVSWSSPKLVQMERMAKDPEDPLTPPSWCNWQRPLRLGKDGKFLVGVSRHGKIPGQEKGSCTIEFLQFDNIDDNPEVQEIQLSWFSTNENVLEVTHEKFGSACEEAGIVKLPDGRLFALMRTCAGYPFWSQSRDDGVTWSKPQKLLDRDGGTAYLHPRSPCPIYDWKGPEAASGYYFALVHNTFDFDGPREYQQRGPLYLIAGRFNPETEQPIEFTQMKLFAPRDGGNSFYTSYTIVDGKGILWFPDRKFFLLGRTIDAEWFDN